MISLTNRQARQFILLKQGLTGEYKFIGKQGVLDFIRQAGCIQFDPVDVCGRNSEIVLNSRIGNYNKNMLDELLYKDRLLIDYFDKNLSIFPVEDAPAFYGRKLSGGYAEAFDERGGDAVKQMEPVIRRLIEERGHISAKEVDVDETIVWHWGVITSLPRAALESMYFRGELIVHHKTGTNKSYAFSKDYIPSDILDAAPPFNTEEERLAWHVRRRIGAVGMLWNRPSDAWLGLSLKADQRRCAFEKLLSDDSISGVAVEGINDTLYYLTEDKPLIEAVLKNPQPQPRCELIAPLDSFIWDRKLIKALFGFEYIWEIYTPAIKRKYGAYVLPVLSGENLIGRTEVVNDRKSKALIVKNIWYEDGIKLAKTQKAELEKCFWRFAEFNDCYSVIL